MKTKQAKIELDAARQALADAEEAYRRAETANQDHAALLAKTEADLIALAADVSGSLGSPETAAEWRQRRAKLAAEIEGLRIQAGALAAALAPASDLIDRRRAELQSAEQTMYRAELKEMLAGPKMAEAAETFARAWVLHVHGDNPYLPIGDAAAMGAWLFGLDGIFPLRRMLERIKID